MRQIPFGLVLALAASALCLLAFTSSASAGGGGTSVTAVSFKPANAHAGATGNWTIDFTSSGSGALVGGIGNGFVDIAFPSGFGLPSSATLGSGFSCSASHSAAVGFIAAGEFELDLPTGCTLPTSTAAVLTLAGVKNPGTPGSYSGSRIFTSSDYVPTAAGNITINATTPGPPRSVTAKAGDGKASVSWKAPASTGGATISKYTVTSNRDNKTCTTTGALTCTVGGLTNGASYTFTVTAKNSAGTGHASAPSNSVTPQAALKPWIVTGFDGVVKVFDAKTGAVLTSITPFPSYQGDLSVATGDVNGDGTSDIVVAPGPGIATTVRVYNGRTFALLTSFTPFPGGFIGGASVAAGDVNGDGKADIVVGAGPGGQPAVRVYSGANDAVLTSFFAFDSGFSGGVTVAAGDVNGDGKADIVVGPGAGGGPDVKVYSGANLGLLASFFAYDPSFVGGVSVAAGDVNGDGKADIVVGAGPGGGPTVRVFSGADETGLGDFFAFASSYTGGITVASGDVNGDGKAEIVAAKNPVHGERPAIAAFDGAGHAITIASLPAGVTASGSSRSVGSVVAVGYTRG